MTLALMVAAEPMRASTWLEVVRPTIEPAASPKTIRPIWKVLAPSASRMDGVRATQLAMPTPDSAKITKTALRQATICDRVSTSDPAGWLDAGAGWDTAFLWFCSGTDRDGYRWFGDPRGRCCQASAVRVAGGSGVESFRLESFRTRAGRDGFELVESVADGPSGISPSADARPRIADIAHVEGIDPFRLPL